MNKFENAKLHLLFNLTFLNSAYSRDKLGLSYQIRGYLINKKV